MYNTINNKIRISPTSNYLLFVFYILTLVTSNELKEPRLKGTNASS